MAATAGASEKEKETKESRASRFNPLDTVVVAICTRSSERDWKTKRETAAPERHCVDLSGSQALVERESEP